jgi:hypothetical protein
VSANDITRHYSIPENVQEILKRSCTDCHSNHTNYPWYSNIQPVGWWLQYHIDEGKHELNFSEFATYTPKRQHHKMEETIEMIEQNEMPLNSYLWIHHDAKLNDADKKTLIDWAGHLRDELAKKHNLSSTP